MVVVVDFTADGNADDVEYQDYDQVQENILKKEEEKARRAALSPEALEELNQKEEGERLAKEARQARRLERKRLHSERGEQTESDPHANSKPAPVEIHPSFLGQTKVFQLKREPEVQAKKQKTEEVTSKHYSAMCMRFMAGAARAYSPPPEKEQQSNDLMVAAEGLLNLRLDSAQAPIPMPVAKVIESQVLVQGDPAVSVNTDAPQDGAGDDPDETQDGAGGESGASQDGEGGESGASQDGEGSESDASQDGEGGESDASQDGEGGESDASQDGEGGESDASQDGEGGDPDETQDGADDESDAPPDGAGDDPDETQDGAGGDQDAPPDDASKVADEPQGAGKADEPVMSYVPDSQPPDSQAALANPVPIDPDASQTDGAGAGSFVPETQPPPDGVRSLTDPNAGAGQAASGVLRAVATGVDMAEVLQKSLEEFGDNNGAVAPYELLPSGYTYAAANLSKDVKLVVKEWKSWWHELSPFDGVTFSSLSFTFKSRDTPKTDLSALMPDIPWVKEMFSGMDDRKPKDNRHPSNLFLAATFTQVKKKFINVFIWKQSRKTKKLDLWLYNPKAVHNKQVIDILVELDETKNEYHYFLLHRESRAPPADGAAPA